MEQYKATLDSTGEALVLWADPEQKFTGYTEVRRFVVAFCVFFFSSLPLPPVSFNVRLTILVRLIPFSFLLFIPSFLSKYTIQGWFLTDFYSAFNIALAYFLFVVIGSQIMAFLPAMDPYPIKFIYNVSQIMLCAYMTIEAVLLAYRNGYSLTPCVGYSQDNPALANLLWLFYVSKVWDFWDTIFIVLGKKWRQLSFLHVYHHITIFLFYWLNSNVFYDGDIYLTIVLNGFIHTVMVSNEVAGISFFFLS